MKRLKKYFLDMDVKDGTYNAIYMGAYGFTQKGEVIYNNPQMEGVVFDSTYWFEEISYTIERTHKLALDKPTIKIKIPFSKLNIKSDKNKEIIADYCLRDFGTYTKELNEEIYNRSRSDKENGAFYIHNPTSEVLERNSCYVINNDELFLNIMIMVQLPLKNHRKAMRMICNSLTSAVQGFITNFNNEILDEAIKTYETQISIRKWLKSSDYCAFVANGSILPRNKGTEEPQSNSIPFKAPKEDEIEICGMKGMGIKKGVTIITGGGYSGKSTLLNAVSLGVYNHILGDGREFVITDDTAIQILAEDGRSVKNVDLSPFIKWLPNGEVGHFDTNHASGSISQAANVMEAINFGSKLLLIDEDKSATNFMIKDKIMNLLIKKDPITPFTQRVNEIFNKMKVSTILVVGGTSEYLFIADNVIMMEEFIAINSTEKVKSICVENKVMIENIKDTNWHFEHNSILSEGFSPYPKDKTVEKLEISDMGFVVIGDEKIDIRALCNIISMEQLNCIGFMLRNIELSSHNNYKIDVCEKVDVLYEKLRKDGVDSVYSTAFIANRWLEIPRKYELHSVINRMKNIEFL